MDHDMMDHDYIEEHQIAERFVLGSLTTEEAEAFETHTLYCGSCRERLDATAALVEGLRTVAAEDGALLGRLGFLGWWARRRLATRLALALLLCAGLLAPSGLLWLRLDQSRDTLARALHPTSAAVLTLMPLRGPGNGEPSHRVALGDRRGTLVLALPLAEGPVGERYRVSIEDAAGATAWRLDDLVPGPGAELVVSIPTASLAPGIYRVFVDTGPTDAPSRSPYSFRAID